MQISEESPLLLASGSPRRRELLTGLGIPLLVRPADADEDVDEEDPHALIERVVERKLAAALDAVVPGDTFAALLVADTIVVLDGEVMGKPRDVAHATTLVRRLAGRTHTVFTRYAVRARTTVLRTIQSRVTMASVSEDTIARYAATGEGLDKAGAYAVQGIGAFLVRSIEGSYSNVVGLPVCEVVEDLERLELLKDFPGG